ncbi:MAG TPA: ribonuclease activity regulator RraA, partial [Stellaceae bacterium]|nr:ribonuclease activity regulator RraA [Stellaceae bacterium]
MSTTPIGEDTKALLRKCSVATLSTQLFKRGLRQTVMQGVRPLAQGPELMVGEAFTVRFIPAREDLDQVSVFNDPDHPQRKAIETAPPGHVLVCDCRGDARAASG